MRDVVLRRTALFVFLAAAGCLLALPGRARTEQAAPGKEEKRTTATYDVADLLYKPGGKSGYSRIDDLIKDLLNQVDPRSWNSTKEGASTLHEVNGTKLEVHATAEQHAQLKEVLAALRRLNDLAVDVRAELYEVERGVFDKTFKPKLEGGRKAADRLVPAVIEDALADQLRKKATRLRSGEVRIAPGREARLLSERRALTYAADPAGSGTVLVGMTCQVSGTVTADRRQVRLRLTEQVTDLLGLKEQSRVDPNTGKEVTVEHPELAESSVTASVTADDGAYVLVPVRYLPAAVKDKDRVLVILLRPIIYIEEEEQARKKKGGGA